MAWKIAEPEGNERQLPTNSRRRPPAEAVGRQLPTFGSSDGIVHYRNQPLVVAAGKIRIRSFYLLQELKTNALGGCSFLCFRYISASSGMII